MRNLAIKTDDSGDVLNADAFNTNLGTELEGVCTSAGFTLDPEAGPDANTTMLAQSISAYANAGQQYQDSGVADAYVLAIATNLKSVSKYYDGMKVTFEPGNTNTGPSTVNIATLGSKSITWADGTALSAEDILAGTFLTIVYNLSDDRFEIAAPNTFSGGLLGLGVSPISAKLHIKHGGDYGLTVAEAYTLKLIAKTATSGNGNRGATIGFEKQTGGGVHSGLYGIQTGADPNQYGLGFFTNTTNSPDALAEALRIAHDGTFTGSASADISDERLKENIEDIAGALSIILQLKGRTFNWKPEAKMSEGTKWGMIAQEVEAVIPDLIVEHTGIREIEKGVYYKSLTMSGVIPVLVEAVKELAGKVKVLETA